METGVLGVLCQLAVSPAERVLKIALDFATIQHHTMEEQHAQDQALKMLLAIHNNVQLVKKL